MSNKKSSVELKTELNSLRESQKTLQLATIDGKGQPLASYAPYVWHAGHYYLFLSELAKHTINLINNQKVSLLIIEGEAECRNLFARRRIILEGSVTRIERATAQYNAVMPVFKDQFGDFMNLIEPLQDFHLFEVQPLSGRLVLGFAQAYELSGPDCDEIQHLDSGSG